MSAWSAAGNATLGEIITYLRTLPREQHVPHGFGEPQSYRGYYEDLAFEPVADTTVGAMLDAAESALGKTFTGYKGGEFKMTECTDCWLAEYGSSGVPIVLPDSELAYRLPSPAPPATEGD